MLERGKRASMNIRHCASQNDGGGAQTVSLGFKGKALVGF